MKKENRVILNEGDVCKIQLHNTSGALLKKKIFQTNTCSIRSVMKHQTCKQWVMGLNSRQSIVQKTKFTIGPHCHCAGMATGVQN